MIAMYIHACLCLGAGMYVCVCVSGRVNYSVSKCSLAFIHEPNFGIGVPVQIALRTPADAFVGLDSQRHRHSSL